MSAIQEIVKGLGQIESDLSKCARCGMCLAVCPVYLETGREGDAARGKLALLDGLGALLFDSSRGVADRLDRCLLCGSCAAVCPNGVNASDLFLKARMILSEARRLPSLQKVLLKKLLSESKTFHRVMRWSAEFRNLVAKPENAVIGTSSFRFSSSDPSRRHFIFPADTSFQAGIGADPVAPSSGPTVLFFIGCLIDRFFPRIAEAVVSVFKQHHIRCLIPPDQGCCGMPSASAGDGKTMKRLLYHHIEMFCRYESDAIVTACATCTHVIKNLWPQMAENDPELKAHALEIAAKTYDINEFLAPRIASHHTNTNADNRPRIVTYHDPCHLKKSLGISDQPRSLISANPSCRLVEMEHPDRCCGMGGTFNLHHYELSEKIGRRKIESIVATRCDTVATGCPACMMQLADFLSKYRQNVKVVHPVEMYAEAISGFRKPEMLRTEP
ncbi:MAG: (Fe-S)-binding protein [Desulfobacterales bacterium]